MSIRHTWRIRRIRGGKWFRERGQKALPLLPHLFTLFNLTFGVIGIILAAREEFYKAALMVIGSLIADGLDGRVARWVKSDGEFGRELDSLADVVAFGVAPSVIIFGAGLQYWGAYGWIIAVLFPICGALRLARFNIIKTSGFFVGLPITAGGSIIASFVIYAGPELNGMAHWAYPLAMLFVSYLMISTIPYPDFKKRHAARVSVLPYVVPVLLVLYALSRDLRTLIFLPLASYAFFGFYIYLLRKWSEKVTPLLRPADK